MAIRICPNGHRYDDQRNSECPICSRGRIADMDATVGAYGSGTRGSLPQEPFPESELDATIGAYGFSSTSTSYSPAKPSSGSMGRTLPLDFSAEDDGPTISAFNYGAEKSFSPVAGWLVCIDGPEKGRDFRLYTGRNFAGRSPKMQINIADDPQINRDGHFSIVFDPESKAWFIISGAGTVTYLDDVLLEGARPLRDMARIKAGSSLFCFRSLCGEEFCW